MLGQIPAYSSYIAIGCGARVISDTEKIPTSYSISGSTVTVTISGGHKFNVGDSVVVDMNDSRVDGEKTVATASSTQITFPANYTIPALTAINDVFPGTGYAIITAASAHRLVVGDLVTTDFTEINFDNTDVAVYAIPSSTTFIIAEAGTGSTSAGTLSTIKPVVQANSTISLNHSTKRKLNFEMTRIPVTSRGLAVEDGVDMLVFGAEVPTQDRFGISEIGLFSAGTNNIVTGSDSTIMHTLANFENWELHDSVSATTVLPYSGAVAPSTGSPTTTGTPLSLPTTTYATFINASDQAFNNVNRTRLYEKPRMYDSTLVVQGDLSVITGMSSGVSSMAYSTINANDSRHVHLLGQTYNFSSNSSSDEIRLAFSVLYRNMSTISDPSYVGIIIEFSSEADVANTKFARMKIRKTSADLAKSHYFIETVSLNDLEKSATFSWDSVDTIKIYAMVDAVTKTDYYISLDALRFENVYDEQQNASYGMVGYATARSTKTINSTVYTTPIEKETNRSGLIEFKLPIQLGEL